MSARLRGLYVLTDATLQPDDELIRRVDQSIDGGAALLQYRDKSTDAARRLRQARALAALCRTRDVVFIVNDDVQLALDSGADGVHLGRDDATPAEARQRLGPSRLIGVSCYAQWPRALDARAQGADYIAFGRFYPSRTKPLAEQANLDLIRRAKRQLSLPVAAIGGITPNNGAALIEAGADMLAVVQGVFAAEDCRQAARAYAGLFATPAHRNQPPDSGERSNHP